MIVKYNLFYHFLNKLNVIKRIIAYAYTTKKRIKNYFLIFLYDKNV